ncbi:MAG TPA: hypothetical protein VF625_05320 [Longimicrobium sp.]
MTGISIQLSTGDGGSVAPEVTASGTVTHIITDDERDSFGIGDSVLKLAVEMYFGQLPADAFLHDPTPWNNLYATYGWAPVTTVLTAVKADVVEVTSEPIFLGQNTFTNSSNKVGTFTAGVSDSVSDTVESSWSETHGLAASQMIRYGVSFLGAGGGGETTLSYNATFGTAGSESTSFTVGSEQAVSVVLQPGESVIAKLNASRGTIKVRVTYSVSLQGNTAVNYGDTFKGHHFWALDIGNVMRAVGLPSSFEITEDLEIGYFFNAAISLENPTAWRALAEAA